MPVLIFCKSKILTQMLVNTCEAAGFSVLKTLDSLGALERVSGDTVLLMHMTENCRDLFGKIGFVRERSGIGRVVVLGEAGILNRALTEVHEHVDAFVPEDSPLEILTAALRLVEAGYRVFFRDHPMASELAVARNTRARETVGDPERLTRRELAILARLSEGRSNKSIARDLGVSEATVKVHLRAVYRKTGSSNRTQAALWGRSVLGEMALEGDPSKQGA